MHFFFFYLLALANLLSLLNIGFSMIGANAYDIAQIRRKAKKRALPAVQSRQPLVSVVIPAHNEAVVIKRTLDSVRASSYQNLEIIVVDDGSTDRTDTIVREYITHLPDTKTVSFVRSMVRMPARHAERAKGRAKLTDNVYRIYGRHFDRVSAVTIRTVRVSQRNAGKAVAMNNAIANQAHGEFVMCLDADSILHPKAVEHALKYFADPRIIGVAANVRVMETKSVLGMVQRFEHMVGYRAKKFYSLTNSEFIIGGVASTYRLDALKKVDLYDVDTVTEDIGLSLKLISSQGNRDARIVYGSDVLAMTEGVQTFRQLLRQRYRWKMGCLQNLFKYRHLMLNRDSNKYTRLLTMYRLPMALVGEAMLMMQPLLWGYVLYLTIHLHTLNILLGSYLIVTLYVLWTVWPDEHLSQREKLRMSERALIIYALFYMMDVVQIVAIFRCLKEHKKVTSRSAATTWVSPVRTGQALRV